MAPAAQDAAILTTATGLHRGLDLTQGPLVQAALFLRGPDAPARLILVVHHLVMDWVSWQIVLDDWQMAYEQLAQGRSVRLPAVPTSFARWAHGAGGVCSGPDPGRRTGVLAQRGGFPHCGLAA